VARKATDTIQLKLRFSEALRRRLERAADAHDLSMNSEIVRRLEDSFRDENRQAEMEAMANKAAARAVDSFLNLSPADLPTTVPEAARLIHKKPFPGTPFPERKEGRDK
jgi:hypothetical protein